MLRRMIKGFSVVFAVGLLAGAGAVGYFGLQAGRSIFELLTENRQLQEAPGNLTQQRQIGYAKVLDQFEEDGVPCTRLLFVVTDPEDQTRRVLEQEFVVEGDVVFFDALVVKFHADLVKDGRERALYLWRRIYGEHTPPSEGQPIETPGEAPSRYAEVFGRLDPRDRNLFWQEIWKLADDPGRLALAGVQAIYGNAVYKELRPGLIYVFNLDASGTFYLESVPAL